MRREMRDLRDLLLKRHSAQLSMPDLPPGERRPVVLVPGLGAFDSSLGALGRRLDALGYAPSRAGIGVNVRCGDEATQSLLARVEALAREHGQRVAIVGHSRGGHLARVAAVRRPDLISGIVTLGTPEPELSAIHPSVRVLALGIGVAGSLRIPGPYKLACFTNGSCCESYRRELRAPFPADVGFVAVWSKADVFVDWRRLTDRDAEWIEVDATHIGMAIEPEVVGAVARSIPGFYTRDGEHGEPAAEVGAQAAQASA